MNPRIDQVRDWLLGIIDQTAHAIEGTIDGAADRTQEALDRLTKYTHDLLEYVHGGYVPQQESQQVRDLTASRIQTAAESTKSE